MLYTRAFRNCSLLIACGLLMAGNIEAQKLLGSIVTYYYPENGDSVKGVKIADEYNGAGQKISNSIYLWNTKTRRWDGWQFYCEECSSSPGRYEYEYDAKGNQVIITNFTWWGHETGWIFRGRTENSYDDWGNNVTTLFSGWNSGKKEWEPLFAYEYEYDIAGRILSKVTFDRSPPLQDWHPLEKILNTYDSQARKKQEIRQVWNDTARDWAIQSLIEWYYDSTGITTEWATFRWITSGLINEWKEDQRHRIVKEFDQAGNLLLTTESEKVSKTRWTPVRKEESAYNSSGQPVLLVISEGSGSLTERFRTEWEYDPDGRLATETLTGPMARWPGPLPVKKRQMVIRTFDDEGDIVRVTWHDWDYQTQSYLLASKDYYYYQSTSSGDQKTGIDPLRVYPNPTRGILYFTGLTKPVEVRIFSLQGVLLRSIQQVVISADISDLPPGTYLILVSEGGHTPVRTILIKE